jgi:hypoxanthine phosphoribosyltransferase
MTPEDEERAIIVRARARLAYVDSLDERYRTLAMLMVPESEWEERARWAEATIAAMKGETRRVWRKDHWVTEKAPAEAEARSR